MDLVKRLIEVTEEELLKHGQKKIDDYIKQLKKTSENEIARIEAELRADLVGIAAKVSQEMRVSVQHFSEETVHPVIKIEVSL